MARVVGGFVELVGEERHDGGSELIGKLLSVIRLVGNELVGKVLSRLVGKLSGKELVPNNWVGSSVGNSLGCWEGNSAGKSVGNFVDNSVGSWIGNSAGKSSVGNFVGKERVGKRAPQLQLDLSFRLLQPAISQYDLMTLLELQGGKFYKLSNLPGSHLTLPLHHLPGNWNCLFLLSPMSSCF